MVDTFGPYRLRKLATRLKDFPTRRDVRECRDALLGAAQELDRCRRKARKLQRDIDELLESVECAPTSPTE